ncbi:MAG: hypothetical protein VX777_04680 [Chlamydiota bacterium]|nr:hypothetical protein [Chlamydiota bacterium]
MINSKSILENIPDTWDEESKNTFNSKCNTRIQNLQELITLASNNICKLTSADFAIRGESLSKLLKLVSLQDRETQAALYAEVNGIFEKIHPSTEIDLDEPKITTPKLYLPADGCGFELIKVEKLLLEARLLPQNLPIKRSRAEAEIPDTSLEQEYTNITARDIQNRYLASNIDKNSTETSIIISEVEESNEYSIQIDVRKTTLDLTECSKLEDEDIKVITEKLPHLEILKLNAFELTETSFMYLSELKNLKKLYIFQCDSITDSAIKHLSKLKKLEVLDLSTGDNKSITDTGIEHLKNLKKLRSLNLFGLAKITDKSIENLSSITSLEKINLTWCYGITAAGLNHLTKLKNLKKLFLGWLDKLRDNDLQFLKELNNLEEIDICKNKHYTDKVIVHLKELKKLKKLTFSLNNNITEQSFKDLNELKNLKQLHLDWDSDFNQKCLSVLEEFPCLEDLILTDAFSLTDTTIDHIKPPASLKKLELQKHASFTIKKLSEFKRKFPQIQILIKEAICEVDLNLTTSGSL